MPSGGPLPVGLRQLWTRGVLRLQQRAPSLRAVHRLSRWLLPGGPVFRPRRQNLPGVQHERAKHKTKAERHRRAAESSVKY